MTSFRHTKFISALVFLSLLTAAASGAPPKVIRTIPENGVKDVDPALRQIRIVFDQDMNQDGYSICGGGQSYPETAGKPRWINGRTFVIRVKLVPNHKYQLSINCQSYKNFQNTRGESAEPYPIEFTTSANRQRKKAGMLNSTDNLDAIQELRRAIDEGYSYRDFRKVDWNNLFDKYSTPMKNAKTPRQFAEAAADMLAEAKDIHIWIKVKNDTIGRFKRRFTRNYNRELLEKIVPHWRKRSAVVFTGRFDDGIGYILIDSWSRRDTKQLDPAYKAIQQFADAPGLIIDVRSNSGGAEPLAQEFAGCFIDEPEVYARHAYRTVGEPGGFAKPYNRVLEPNKERPGYRGKVAVLMGQENMSSCEAFLLMMKQIPGCKLVGEKSYGSSGNPKPTDLGNGVTVFLPSWKALRLDDTCFEGEGIAPDILVKTTKKELLKRDAVLEAALKLLREP